MSCQDIEVLLHGYLDGELDLAGSLEIERHLKSCPACARAFEEHKALRAAIRQSSLYLEAPPALSKRIRSAVRQTAKKKTLHITWPRIWAFAGVSMAIAVVALVILAPSLWRSSGQDRLLQALVAAHVRSLMVNHLTDVASSDQHTVKPWFNGKIDFAPAFSDLAAQGFPLVGGRLDYLLDRPVAAVVYHRRKHYINMFIWPTVPTANAPMKAMSRQGYHLVFWEQSGLAYWAVSDVNLADLQEFARLVNTQAAPAKP